MNRCFFGDEKSSLTMKMFLPDGSMKLLLCILLCPHLRFFTAAVMSCPPLKDGQTFRVSCNLSTTPESPEFLEWTIERYQNVDLSVANCSLSNQTCSGPFRARLGFNGSFVESNLTDVKASTSYRSFKCRLSPSRFPAWSACSGALVVYTPPENVTCDPPTVGTNVTVTCRTSKVSPGIRCEFFTRWSGDPASTTVNGSIEYKNEEYSLRVDGEIVPYNSSNCTLTVPRTSFLSGIHDISVRMFSSSDASKTDAVNSTAGSVTLDTRITSFTANDGNTSLSTSGGSSVTFDCAVGPVAATKITLFSSLRNMEVSSVDKSRRLNYTIDNFGCDNVTVYICQVDGLTSSNRSLMVSTNCPPKLLTQQTEDRFHAVESGQSSYFSFSVSGWPQNYTFSLDFVENGAIYRARQELYTVHFQPDTPVGGRVNLAMYQIKDSDFRSYNLSISNEEGEPLKVPLGVRKEPENAHRLALGLGLGLTLGPVVLVLTIIGAVCWWTRRGRGQAESPEELKYDSLSQEHLGRPYTYRKPSLGADQRSQAVSMRDESDRSTSSQDNRMSKDQGARQSVVKAKPLYASVHRPTRDRTDEAYSNDDHETEIGVCVDNIYNNSC